MKSIITTICISLMLIVPNAWADSSESGAYNFQKQDQVIGGVSFGSQGAISGYEQQAVGEGGSYAYPGSDAQEGQAQLQQIYITGNNGYSVHNYNTATFTSGGTITNGPGIAGHVEYANTQGATITVGDGAGQAGVGGQAVKVSTGSASGSTPGSGSITFTEVKYLNSYKYVNPGTSSYTYHEGWTAGTYATGTITSGGIAGATSEGTQAGVTMATNDGSGTSMAGYSVSKGVVQTSTGSLGNALSGAVADQAQYHAYKQEAVGYGTYQGQEGYTYTHNHAEN